MEEIEVKIIEINKEEMIRKILELGAKKVFEGDVNTVFYDFENNSLADKESLLRLRTKGDKAFLTYKEKITQEGAKVMKEIESEIADFDTLHKILLKLDLKSSKNYKKKRTTYKIKDTLFEFDEYEDIPCYMEIEASTLDIIKEFIKQLEIDKNKVKNWTTKELIEYYKS